MPAGGSSETLPGVSDALVYLAGAMLVGWGVAHVVPTQRVAADLAGVGLDSRRVFVMEWVAEGITHVTLGVLVVLVAATGDSASTARLVYRVVALALVALGTLTLLTGARTPQIWFKACPVTLGLAAALLLAASFA
jgi:hypothetical protein